MIDKFQYNFQENRIKLNDKYYHFKHSILSFIVLRSHVIIQVGRNVFDRYRDMGEDYFEYWNMVDKKEGKVFCFDINKCIWNYDNDVINIYLRDDDWFIDTYSGVEVLCIFDYMFEYHIDIVTGVELNRVIQR